MSNAGNEGLDQNDQMGSLIRVFIPAYRVRECYDILTQWRPRSGYVDVQADLDIHCYT